MLKTEPRLGIGLPCRITVVEQEDGQVQLIAMNMALIARLFNNEQLESYAAQMNTRQLEIMEEVTF
jgi:cytochrome c oxidase cbb3-type subunit 3